LMSDIPKLSEIGGKGSYEPLYILSINDKEG